jgi:hypothetical protein
MKFYHQAPTFWTKSRFELWKDEHKSMLGAVGGIAVGSLERSLLTKGYEN